MTFLLTGHTREDQLGCSTFRALDTRGRGRSQAAAALHLPTGLAGLAIDGDKKSLALLVIGEHDEIVEDYGRCAATVHVF